MELITSLKILFSLGSTQTYIHVYGMLSINGQTPPVYVERGAYYQIDYLCGIYYFVPYRKWCHVAMHTMLYTLA